MYVAVLDKIDSCKGVSPCCLEAMSEKQTSLTLVFDHMYYMVLAVAQSQSCNIWLETMKLGPVGFLHKVWDLLDMETKG